MGWPLTTRSDSMLPSFASWIVFFVVSGTYLARGALFNTIETVLAAKPLRCATSRMVTGVVR
ncbi:MAG: hypothetical protein NVS9B15_13500 [Acidobacteriaceae bacterium]